MRLLPHAGIVPIRPSSSRATATSTAIRAERRTRLSRQCVPDGAEASGQLFAPCSTASAGSSRLEDAAKGERLAFGRRLNGGFRSCLPRPCPGRRTMAYPKPWPPSPASAVALFLLVVGAPPPAPRRPTARAWKRVSGVAHLRYLAGGQGRRRIAGDLRPRAQGRDARLDGAGAGAAGRAGEAAEHQMADGVRQPGRLFQGERPGDAGAHGPGAHRPMAEDAGRHLRALWCAAGHPGGDLGQGIRLRQCQAAGTGADGCSPPRPSWATARTSSGRN